MLVITLHLSLPAPQDCAPVPDNVTFDVSSLFPSNKSYYAYRCLPFHLMLAVQLQG